MIEDIPISVIVLNEEKRVDHVNSCFKNEVGKLLPGFNVNSIINKKITDIIPEYSQDLYKEQVNVFLNNSILRCRLSVSVDKNYVYIELFRDTKYLMEHLAHEFKTRVSTSIELTDMISSSKDKKYIEILKKNSIELAKILVNTIDYLKIMTLVMEVDITMVDIESVLKKFKILHDIKNITTYADKLKLTEAIFHILSYIDSYVIIKSRIHDKNLFLFFTYSGTKIETDEVFKGFLEKEYSKETSCLRLPIAKGLLKLMGGDLILENSSEFSTTFKLILKIV